MRVTFRLGWVLVFALMFLVSNFVLAMAQAASPLAQFKGKWGSDGDAFGQSAVSTMVWSEAMDGQFMRIDYEISMTSKDGKTSRFAGIAYYRAEDDGSFKAFWADNTGDLHPIVAEQDGDALVSIWGTEGIKLGRTRYELNSDGSMTVTDWIKSDGEWRQFNSNTFTRVEAAP